MRASERVSPGELGRALPSSALNGLAREHVAEIQRARILAAAVEVIGERGGAHVTVAHIVARSGVSRRTFYELFADREDCFLVAFDETIQRIATVVLPAYERPSRWPEKMRAGLTALLGCLEDDRAAARLVIVDALGAGAGALERRGRVVSWLIAAVEEGALPKAAPQGGARPKGTRRAGAGAGRGEGPPAMAAEGVVGGVLAVLHARLLVAPPPDASPAIASRATAPGDPSAPPSPAGDSLLELTGPLMSMIVLPYLGSDAARRELARLAPERRSGARAGSLTDPLRELDMRLTYRTVRVLIAVAELRGQGSYPSNREVGAAAGMTDQGQTSKLLSRLHRLGLIQNTGSGRSKGSPNAWTLTLKGEEVEQALARQSTPNPATLTDRAWS